MFLKAFKITMSRAGTTGSVAQVRKIPGASIKDRQTSRHTRLTDGRKIATASAVPRPGFFLVSLN